MDVTPYPILEILGETRTLGMSAENVGHGVLLIAGTHTLNRSGRQYVIRADDARTVAAMPAHWSADAVAAVVVCVVMLGATTVPEAVAA